MSLFFHNNHKKIPVNFSILETLKDIKKKLHHHKMELIKINENNLPDFKNSSVVNC